MRRADGDDIEGVIDAYRAAAQRSLEAGFEIAEVHAAHGYLLHEFLSPVTNRREDDYGGGFENRTRLVREVVAAVRDVWPDDKPVFVRISGRTGSTTASRGISSSRCGWRTRSPIWAPIWSTSVRAGSTPTRRSPVGQTFRCRWPSGSERVPTSPSARSAASPNPNRPTRWSATTGPTSYLVGRGVPAGSGTSTCAAGDLERDPDDAAKQWPVQYRRAVQR